MKREILGVVLCGGKSSRMGEDKAAIELRPGQSQLQYQLGLLEPFCCRLAVGVGPRSRPGPSRRIPGSVSAFFDDERISGPMAGVIAALRFAEGLPVLVVACDMPFLQASHLVQLLNRRDAEQWATCFLASDDAPDPMCCIYEPSALGELEGMASAGNASLRSFLRGSKVERVEVANSSFLASVNDPQQLELARRRLGLD